MSDNTSLVEVKQQSSYSDGPKQIIFSTRTQSTLRHYFVIYQVVDDTLMFATSIHYLNYLKPYNSENQVYNGDYPIRLKHLTIARQRFKKFPFRLKLFTNEDVKLSQLPNSLDKQITATELRRRKLTNCNL